jgi:hypothetical protein
MQRHGGALAAAMFLLFLLGGVPQINAAELNARLGPQFAPPGIIEDDDPDEVKARVARISVVSGDARIKRSDSDEWESVTLNLPVVEGDEIVTEGGARVELQLAKDQHLRLAENSSLKLITFSDDGVALSLSSGTMHIRLRAFTKDKFFEIDAPKSTVAIQSSGSYRIDAGAVGASEIKITAFTGEARIYTETSGFTLKNGRRARLFIDGPTQGEWETGDAVAAMDGFDRWAADRDEAIALRLGAAYYDKYYDDDIYGADDLNDNGQWIYTRDYGYVWRPYASATQSYADWSPYRYGHWRWMPPFGWTWVNDEPWGWATYHHGRWFYYNGSWHWSPYGYYRPSGSWWRPALVAINIIRNNICWYPLGYNQVTININRHYNRRDDHRGRDDRGRDDRGGRPSLPGREDTVAGDRGLRPRVDRVPTGGVVGVNADDFGKRGREIRRMPREIAETVIAAKDDTAPQLPRREEVRRRLGRDIVADRPNLDLAAAQARVGSAKRTGAEPLDKELMTTRILGGRTLRGNRPVENPETQAQPTGIFDRPAPARVRSRTDRPVEPPNPEENAAPARIRARNDRPVESPGTVENGVPARVRNRAERPIQPPDGGENPVRQPDSPKPENVVRRREPPTVREAPKEPQEEQSRPRREPGVVREVPRPSPPAPEKSRETTPRPRETPKSDSAPAKDSPKPERPSNSKKADPID